MQNQVSVVLALDFETHQIIRTIAVVHIRANNPVVFVFRARILQLVVNLAVACVHRSLEHDVRGNIEDLERAVWGQIDEEVERFERLRDVAGHNLCRIHLVCEVILGLIDV